MSWLLLAQATLQAVPPDLTAGIMSALGSGAGAGLTVLFALKWVQASLAAAEAEKQALRERIVTLQAEHNAYLKEKRAEDAQIMRSLIEKGKAS